MTRFPSDSTDSAIEAGVGEAAQVVATQNDWRLARKTNDSVTASRSAVEAEQAGRLSVKKANKQILPARRQHKLSQLDAEHATQQPAIRKDGRSRGAVGGENVRLWRNTSQTLNFFDEHTKPALLRAV